MRAETTLPKICNPMSTFDQLLSELSHLENASEITQKSKLVPIGENLLVFTIIGATFTN